MSYKLKEITIRTNNSKEGLDRVNEVWKDISSGKLPLLFNSEHELQKGISPVSRYSNYESNEKGNYDLTIMAVNADFFKQLNLLTIEGKYVRYEEVDEKGDIESCTMKAWNKVWQNQKSGKINRSFTKDYESTVPKEYAKDGKAHCYLYISII